MTDRLPSVRHASFLFVAMALALTACQPDEHALLLDVHARSDINSITVQVIPRDGSSATARVAQSISRTAAMIASDAPIRIAVSFVGPVDVVVVVRGEALDGPTSATRCYSIRGVVRDDALLVAMPADADADHDGFPGQGAVSCLDPEGVAGSHACDNACSGGVGVDCRGCVGSDCPTAPADEDATIYPGADEICADGVDQDCNGSDIACGDQDGDGWESCGLDNAGACDCADMDRTRNPLALEVCGDGIDQNCDGVDAACDRDGDGFPADLAIGGTPDCDDTDPTVHPDVAGSPTVEVCTADGAMPRDENCNRLIDELTECASDDLDSDGAEDCARTGGAAGCDCNDCDPTVGPSAREICGNSLDENCDGRDSPCLPNDADGDGEIAATAGGTDCNDLPPEGNRFGTNAIEVCGNGIAESCSIDAPCSADTDGDGFAEPSGCEGNPAIVPYTAEVCNGIDDNCDGRIDEPSPAGATPYDACVLPRAGETGCADGRCAVQFASNFYHCGGCRMACDFVATDICVGGTCQCTNSSGTESACTAGSTCCPANGCHNLQNDLNFCGSCGSNCAVLYGARVDSCALGACSCGGGAVCLDGETCCGGRCVDERIDVSNCGNCGNVCSLPFATPVCDMALCQVMTCTGGRANCDGIAPNGCETDLSLAASCGACGVSCSPNARCLTAGASFGCVCNGGYAGDGRSCADINECAAGTPCGTNSVCTNTPASFTCACTSAGYTSADGANCMDINECSAATACGRNLGAVNTCTNTPGSYTCACGAGFMISGAGLAATCIDTNECAAATACGRNLSASNTCANTVGGYTCACGAGFMASGSGLTATCVDIDECAVPGTCGAARAGCVNSAGSYACTCDPGYTAPAMGGTCTDNDECAISSTCGAGRSSCANTAGSYTCSCNSGYTAPPTGGTCTDTDECAIPATCGAARVSCMNTAGSYACTCSPGFSAPAMGGACANINECATASQCGRTLGGGGVNICADTSGGYNCTCGAGFMAMGSGLTATCVNINECASGTPCGTGGTCTDSSGGYSCSCGGAYLDCGGAPDCETMRDSNDCASCGDRCSGGTPKCCLVSGSYTCSSNSTC